MMSFAVRSSHEKNAEVIEYAKRLGTYGEIDRSKQYEGRAYSTDLLRKNDDLAFAKIREQERLQLRNSVITLLLAALISWGPKIIDWILQ